MKVLSKRTYEEVVISHDGTFLKEYPCYGVVFNSDGFVGGHVGWDEGLCQFVFRTDGSEVFSADCLLDIADFLKLANAND